MIRCRSLKICCWLVFYFSTDWIFFSIIFFSLRFFLNDCGSSCSFVFIVLLAAPHPNNNFYIFFLLSFIHINHEIHIINGIQFVFWPLSFRYYSVCLFHFNSTDALIICVYRKDIVVQLSNTFLSYLFFFIFLFQLDYELVAFGYHHKRILRLSYIHVCGNFSS